MRFEKWHALGNAYLLVEQPDAGAMTPERVRRLCDGDTGIGSDGVLEVTGAPRGACGRSHLEPGRLDRRALGQRDPHRRGLAAA